MSRRKGELTAALIDRGWPHQVALPEEACAGNNYKIHADFCRDLSLCPRGKAVFHGDQWWRVFCFQIRSTPMPFASGSEASRSTLRIEGAAGPGRNGASVGRQGVDAPTSGR